MARGRDIDLRRWRIKAREKMLTKRDRCPCGATETDKMSTDRRTDVVCRGCGDVLRRLTELQPTYIQVVGG